MTYRFSDEVDALDASVFSGDALEDKENRELLEEHCKRWLRKIKEMEEPINCPYCREHELHCYYDQTCHGCIERMNHVRT